MTRQALTEPGKIHEAYSRLHEFSLQNQFLAMMQMSQIEPIASYNHWKDIGRQVKKGAKGIGLMMPVFRKAKQEVTEKDRGPPVFYQMRHYWFPLSATDGETYIAPPPPDFDIKRALINLSVTQEPFQSLSGNCMGYAKTDEKIIAVNPLAFDAFKTTVHEITHCLLHPRTVSIDGDKIERSHREVEAELCAFLVCASLGATNNLIYSRGYIQSYLDDTSMEKVRLVLPISNPANLVVFHAGLPPLDRWLGSLLLPSLLSIAATYFVLRWYFRNDLCGSIEGTQGKVELKAGGKMVLWGLGLVVIALLVMSSLKKNLGLPTCIAAMCVTISVCVKNRQSLATGQGDQLADAGACSIALHPRRCGRKHRCAPGYRGGLALGARSRALRWFTRHCICRCGRQ